MPHSHTCADARAGRHGLGAAYASWKMVGRSVVPRSGPGGPARAGVDAGVATMRAARQTAECFCAPDSAARCRRAPRPLLYCRERPEKVVERSPARSVVAGLRARLSPRRAATPAGSALGRARRPAAPRSPRPRVICSTRPTPRECPGQSQQVQVALPEGLCPEAPACRANTSYNERVRTHGRANAIPASTRCGA